MHIIGYIAAALIGISLGLIGGGGSILTVPVLVYCFGIPPALATSYSLFIVGSTSLVGTYTNYRQGHVDFSTAFIFGSSSILTVLITRRFVLPAIPKIIFHTDGFLLHKGLAIMLLFALLMLVVSISMIVTHTEEIIVTEASQKNYGKLVLYGFVIGLLTGLLGVGGGFLLIPALVMLVKMPMKKAIGTSLFIMAMNALIGFAGDIGHYHIDWQFLLIVLAIALAGLLVGNKLSTYFEGEKLKKGFGWFVLAMSIYILSRELFFNR